MLQIVHCPQIYIGAGGKAGASRVSLVAKFILASRKLISAILLNCGEVLKLHQPNHDGNIRGGRVNSLGYGKIGADITMDDPQPSFPLGRRFRD